MINPEVAKQYNSYHGVLLMPVNVCAHCGYEDDPESKWFSDAQGDRVCPSCAEREGN